MTDNGDSIRVRRDPRVQRGPEQQIAVKVRDAEQGTVAPSLKTVEAPARYILAVPDVARGRLDEPDTGLLHDARRLADRCGYAVIAVVPCAVENLGQAGADRVLVAGTRDPDVFYGEACAEFLTAAIRQYEPSHVLFRDSADGGDVARRLASSLDEVLQTNLDREIERYSADQKCDPGARIFMLADCNIVEAPKTIREARPLELKNVSRAPRIRHIKTIRLAADVIPLSDAPLVVGVGNGMRDLELAGEVSRRIGAALGGTRVVCDAGLLPRSRQIGASGQQISADCYVAIGISGAIQHLQGIEACGCVIAVNTDRHAPIMKRADLQIVAEAKPVLHCLIEMAQ